MNCCSLWKKRFNFWISSCGEFNLFFNHWYYELLNLDFLILVFWSLLPASNHSCGYRSSCGPDNLTSSEGLQHASYQLTLRENLLLIFLPFWLPWYASLQIFTFYAALISCCSYFGPEPVFTSKERKSYSKRLSHR